MQSYPINHLCVFSFPPPSSPLPLPPLHRLDQGVNHLSFSPDQKFLLGCGKNRLTYVWDTDTGELVTGKQFPESATLAQWCEVKVSGRRRTYPVSGVCVEVDEMDLTKAPEERSRKGGYRSSGNMLVSWTVGTCR